MFILVAWSVQREPCNKKTYRYCGATFRQQIHCYVGKMMLKAQKTDDVSL